MWPKLAIDNLHARLYNGQYHRNRHVSTNEMQVNKELASIKTQNVVDSVAGHTKTCFFIEKTVQERAT